MAGRGEEDGSVVASFLEMGFDETDLDEAGGDAGTYMVELVAVHPRNSPSSDTPETHSFPLILLSPSPLPGAPHLQCKLKLEGESEMRGAGVHGGERLLRVACGPRSRSYVQE